MLTERAAISELPDDSIEYESSGEIANASYDVEIAMSGFWLV